jgi:hypothetical protein
MEAMCGAMNNIVASCETLANYYLYRSIDLSAILCMSNNMKLFAIFYDATFLVNA